MLSFLADDGEQARRIRDQDWAATPLGAPERWPVALKTLVGVMLGADQPMFVVWGPGLTLIYNDRYSEILQAKHPAALGRPFLDVWREIAGDLRPIVDRAYAGTPVHMDQITLLTERRGYPEETHFSFSYTPVRTDGGAVDGFFCACAEITEQVLAERSRREAEAALAESETRFRNMADNAPVMMWVTEHDGRCTYLNRRWYEFTGQREGDGERLGWLDAVHPDDRPSAEEAFLQANAERRDYRVEFRLKRADGVYRWAIDAAAARFGADGTFLGYVGSVIDIDERREVEAALRAEEARLHAVLDTVPVGIVMAEAPSGRITGGNAQAEAIFGHPVLPSPDAEAYGEWIGYHADGRRVEAADYPLGPVVRGQAERAELELCYQRGDGRHAWLRLIAAPITDDAGRITGGVVASLDIDREKRAEAELRRLNEHLEAQVAERTAERDRVWRLSRDLLGVADTSGRWLSVNPAWTRLLGWSEAEIVGRTSEWLEHPDDRERTRAEIAQLAAGTETFAFENRFRARDGGYRRLSWTATPEGGLTYASARDVTAEKEREAELELAQEQLRQAQKMEAVGQLTGGVAHDFNNLLTVIRGSVDLLRRDDLTPERRARYIDAIGTTADRAAKLTGQLLAFARRQALKPELFDAGDSLRDVAGMMRTLTGSRIAMDVQVPQERCFILADRSQFDTAIINMGINARDAMRGEGTLRIATGPVSGIPPLRGHAAVAGDFVAITVSDDGSGIASADLDRIFEPFFTTKPVGEGTGLGLSQVIGFAKQSGGDIRVDSAVDVGTTFTLYLPRAAAEEFEPAEEDGARPVDGDGVRVLVVEDNEQVGEFATAALNELGYETVLATDAKAALRMLAETGNRFQIVFSDVVMPGMSGLELGQEIRRLGHDVAVVLTSGYSHVLAQNGTHGFELLHKPYSIEQLSRVLRKAVSWRAGRGRASG